MISFLIARMQSWQAPKFQPTFQPTPKIDNTEKSLPKCTELTASRHNDRYCEVKFIESFGHKIDNEYFSAEQHKHGKQNFVKSTG